MGRPRSIRTNISLNAALLKIHQPPATRINIRSTADLRGRNEEILIEEEDFDPCLYDVNQDNYTSGSCSSSDGSCISIGDSDSEQDVTIPIEKRNYTRESINKETMWKNMRYKMYSAHCYYGRR